MAKNPNINPPTKHIATHHHYTREKVEMEETKVELEKTRLIYVPLLEQIADMFTKPLGHGLFEKFRSRLNMISFKQVQF